jgi:hypothetical protein
VTTKQLQKKVRRVNPAGDIQQGCGQEADAFIAETICFHLQPHLVFHGREGDVEDPHGERAVCVEGQGLEVRLFRDG